MGQNRCKNQFLISFITERVPRGAQKCLKSPQIIYRYQMISFRAEDFIFIQRMGLKFQEIM